MIFIYQNLINGGVGIRMSGVENFRKFNKRGGTIIRDLRVQIFLLFASNFKYIDAQNRRSNKENESQKLAQSRHFTNNIQTNLRESWN